MLDQYRASYKEGVDLPIDKAKQIWDFVIGKGRANLEGTAFQTNLPIQEGDITQLKKFYQEVYDKQETELGEGGQIFNRSLREHLLLTERLAKHAAPLLNIDTNTLRAVTLTHDLGRLISHRRGRNNAIERLIVQKLQFSPSLTNLLPPDTLWTARDETSVRNQLRKATTENNGITGAVELIDVLAKYKEGEPGRLRQWEDVIPKTRKGQHLPDQDTMWPSEYRRQTKITSEEGDNSIPLKYNYLKDWFEQTSGIGIDDFIQRVEASLHTEPLTSSWI